MLTMHSPCAAGVACAPAAAELTPHLVQLIEVCFAPPRPQIFAHAGLAWRCPCMGGHQKVSAPTHATAHGSDTGVCEDPSQSGCAVV